MTSSPKSLYVSTSNGASILAGKFQIWRELNLEKTRLRDQARHSGASCKFAVYDVNNAYVCD